MHYFLQSTPLSPGILTLPVKFWLAALCRDVGTVRGNIRSLSGTQVCWGKVLNLVITLAIELFMLRSQGSCVQPPQQVLVERSKDRDVGISCQEDAIKTASCVHDEGYWWMSEGTSSDPVAGLKDNRKRVVKMYPECENMVIRCIKAFEACRTNHLCMRVLACSNICMHVLICICRPGWRQGQGEETANLTAFWCR